MFSVDYPVKGSIAFDSSGRPTASFTLCQKRDDIFHKYRIDDMLIDSGAVLTSLNKKVADINQYPVIKSRELVLMGFNDIGRAIRALIKLGKTDAEAKVYLAQFTGRSKDLLDSLYSDFGITDVGLVCDLRKASYAVLSNYVIEDVIFATPSDDDVIIAEVIGMNVLEKFLLGIDFDSGTIHLGERTGAVSHINPDFVCGPVSIFDTSA